MPIKTESPARKWRDVLPIHPAAELFPRMSPEELKALGEDIKKNGLHVPVALWRADPNAPLQLLDGISRLDAMEMVGIPFDQMKGFHTMKPETDPYAFAISMNIERRHLTTEQKRDLIAKLIKAAPEKSDRQIAETVKADHKTVGSVRTEMEGRGEIPHVSTRTDTKGREQPASKTRTRSTPNVEPIDAEQAVRQIAAEEKRAAKARPTGTAAARKAGELMGLLRDAGPAVQRVFIHHLRDDIGETSASEIARKPSKATTKPESSASAHFEVGAELKDLIATKAPGWTGTTVGTQAEVDAAIERLRDDGAPGHWLIVAPRERVVVDHRVIQWLLLTAPAPPVIAHIEWAFSLCSAANKACCPIWVSERLTGKSHPQRTGILWSRELPIPQQVPADDIGADSTAEAEHLRVRVEELQAQVRQRDIKIAGLESQIAELEKNNGAFQATIRQWEETVETQRNIIRDRDAEIATLRAGRTAPPDDGLGIPEDLDRAKQAAS
jgi:hypothetical protein